MALPNDIGVEPVCTVDDVIPTPVNFGFQLIEWIHDRDPLFSPPRCRRKWPTSASNAVGLKQQNGRTSIRCRCTKPGIGPSMRLRRSQHMNYCFAGKKESKRNVNPMDPFTSLSFCKSVLLAYVKEIGMVIDLFAVGNSRRVLNARIGPARSIF